MFLCCILLNFVFICAFFDFPNCSVMLILRPDLLYVTTFCFLYCYKYKEMAWGQGGKSTVYCKLYINECIGKTLLNKKWKHQVKVKVVLTDKIK